jgi:hypothetical protein
MRRVRKRRWPVSKQISKSASQRKGPEAMLWGLLFEQKTDFSGDFQGANLAIWDILG